MTAALMLPSYGNSSRTDLILEVARLGLLVEDATHHLSPAEDGRSRAQFHHAMAALLALTEAEQADGGKADPETCARVAAFRKHHESLVEQYRQDLKELAQQGGDTDAS